VKPLTWISTEVIGSFLRSLYESLSPTERLNEGIESIFASGVEVHIQEPVEWNYDWSKTGSLPSSSTLRTKLAMIFPLHQPGHWTSIIVDRHRGLIYLYDGYTSVPKLLREKPTLREAIEATCPPALGWSREAIPEAASSQKPSNSFFRMVYHLKLLFISNAGFINLPSETDDGSSELDFKIEAFNTPKQEDSYNCGPLSCCFIEAFLRGKLTELTESQKAVSSAHMDMYRFHIMEVCTQRLVEENLVEAACASP
jgi:hypothetical protein